MNHVSQKPDIFTYLDFRLYLSDILSWIREKDPEFTFQKLTETSELNSRSHFIDILNGRKLTKKFLPVYQKICELNGKEAKYFRALVLYNQPSVSENKRELFKTISELSSSPDAIKLEGEVYTFYKHWSIPAMYSMISIVRNVRDHRVLARLFNPPLSAIQARNALQVLIQLEMISWNKDKNKWITRKKQFLSSTDAQAAALREFHKQVQQLGRYTFEADLEKQTFYAQTHCVSLKLKKKIDEMILEFQRKILDLINEDTSPEVLLQINTQAFYLSQIISLHSPQPSSL